MFLSYINRLVHTIHTLLYNCIFLYIESQTVFMVAIYLHATKMDYKHAESRK